ncbi:MAG: DinB family protein [Candidatus Palauibacterales bacterium]|nr:DinB family protein [Candidatus Palauibacterales bacterium]MDP2583998.1 DinB family protein [Candidatus Palauibacterales bacterium]
MSRPDPSEHAAYYSRYIDLVPEGDVPRTLATQMDETQALLASVPPDRETYRYAPGKWSIRQVVGHLIDTERVFAFRSLWFARAAGSALPSMEQNEWAEVSNAGSRALTELRDEWAALRRDTVAMLRGFDDEAWTCTGVASDSPISVRACAWIIAGHELWHRRGLVRDYGVG